MEEGPRIWSEDKNFNSAKSTKENKQKKKNKYSYQLLIKKNYHFSHVKQDDWLFLGNVLSSTTVRCKC